MPQDLSSLVARSADLSSVLSGQGPSQLWLEDRQAMDRAGLASCKSIPKGAESLLVQRVGPAKDKAAGLLFVFSERAR